MVKHKNILTKQNDEECLCCGFKGNGIGVLFQVNSCRGCASFFKRSITLGLQFRCISGDYQCEIKSGSKMCRFCRLKKCIKVGMTLKIKNEKSEKRFKENVVKEELICSMSLALNACSNNLHQTLSSENNSYVMQSTSESSSNMSLSNAQFSYKESQLSIEHKSILEDVTTILSGPFIKNNVFDIIYNPTCLQRMAICLQQYFSKWGMKSKEEIAINKPIPYPDFIAFRLQAFRMEAEMLMSLPEFSGLCYSERTLLYRIFWPRFGSFSNIELALQTFGYDDENCIFVVKNDQVLEIGPDNRYPDELFTDDPFERRKIMRSGFENFITELYKPIKKLRLDRIELSFLIIQILWSHKKRDDLCESTFSMMEKILKVASTELQHYYIYEKKTDNYSWRLVEITKLIAKSTEAATLLSDNFLKAKILGQFGPDKWSSTDNVICPLI